MPTQYTQSNPDFLDYIGWKDKQVAVEMTAKGCITFVTYQIILTHTGYSSYFTVGQSMAPNCLFLWRIQAQPNTWFLGPTRVHTPNGISIGSAVFVGIKVVSNRHTVKEHATLVPIGCFLTKVVSRVGHKTQEVLKYYYYTRLMAFFPGQPG